MQELFIYYRVRHGCEALAAQAVLQAQRELAGAHAGLQARLLQRVDTEELTAADAGAEPRRPTTWMEIYRHPQGVGAGMRESIERCVQAAGLLGYLEGPRHIEIFQPCA